MGKPILCRRNGAAASTYTPEGALAVAHQRRRKAEVDTTLTRCDKGSDALAASVDQDNPLVKKLLRMQQRSKDSDCRQ